MLAFLLLKGLGIVIFAVRVLGGMQLSTHAASAYHQSARMQRMRHAATALTVDAASGI